MSEPTLAQIPVILGRTLLRLFARLVWVLAMAFLLVGMGLSLCALLVATWRTPRGRRTQLAVSCVLLATELLKDAHRKRN